LELATVLLSQVIEMENSPGNGPLDFKGNDDGNGRPLFSYCVLKAPIIFHVEILHFIGCRASGQVNRDIVRIDNGGPEESITSNARVKIMDLRAPQLGVINVNSYEAERSIADVSIATLVNALHEGHVISLRGQIRPDLASSPISLARGGIDKGNGSVSLKVPD